MEIDPDYVPAPVERRQIFGVTFEQGRNDYKVEPGMFTNIVTKNKELPAEGVRDLMIALITLKYTQSNSVCYVYKGQAIGIGAGQQSRIHCTCLAGGKADLWQLRRHPQVLNLPFKEGIGRPDRDNTINAYLNPEYGDVLSEGMWQQFFREKPEELTQAQRKEWLAKVKGVALGSDAFFPFGDNIQRAVKSGVSYIAEPGGSIRDDQVIQTCDSFGIVMAFTGMRLFHH